MPLKMYEFANKHLVIFATRVRCNKNLDPISDLVLIFCCEAGQNFGGRVTITL